MMQSVTLIGGKGAIGTKLCALFRALKWRVRIYDQCEQRKYNYELQSRSDLYIWLATIHHNRNADGSLVADFTDDIDMYTRYLSQNDLTDAWHIYFSSSHVYRTAAGDITAYGQYKQLVEKLFHHYTPNLLILRPFFVIDAYRRGSTQIKLMSHNDISTHDKPIWYSDCHLLARTCIDFITDHQASVVDVRYPQRRTLRDIYGYDFPMAPKYEEENIIP